MTYASRAEWQSPSSADGYAAGASALAERAKVNGAAIDLGGPEKKPMADFMRELYAAKGETKKTLADSEGRTFGAKLEDTSLVTLGVAMMGKVRFCGVGGEVRLGRFAKCLSSLIGCSW